MSKKSKSTKGFRGTESELVSMTSDLDQLHHDVGMQAMEAGVSEMIEHMGEAPGPSSNSRRTFLIGTGAAFAGGAALLAMGAAPSRLPRPQGGRVSVATSFPRRRLPPGQPQR